MIPTQPEHRGPVAEAEYRRLVISYFDALEATQFLNRLIALGPVRTDEGDAIGEARRAFTISSILAYARPFTKNHGAPETAARIKIEEVANVTSDQLEIHRRLMERRDRALAHSDAVTASLTYDREHPNGPVPNVVDPRVALSYAGAQNVHALAWKVASWAASRAAAISGVAVIASRRDAPSDL